MTTTNPRRTGKIMSSGMTPSTAAVNTSMILRKGATFHSPPTSPLSDRPFNIPSLPRRSETTLDDVIDAHKRRMALTLEDLESSLSCLSVGSESTTGQSFQDNGFPALQEELNHTVASRRPLQTKNIMTNKANEDSISDTSARTLRPRRQVLRIPSYKSSDSDNESDSMSDQQSTSTGATSVTAGSPVKAAVAAPALSRGIAAHASHPRLSVRASNKIHEHVLRPLLAKTSLKDFHSILKDCPRRIHDREIVCLRDLEKTLMFMAPTRSKSAQSYLDFCTTSILCIQATVEFLSEREQTRPNDRPYTNGYFIDLVDQIKNYAQQIQTTKEKEAKGESLDEKDAHSYVSPFSFHSPTPKADKAFGVAMPMSHTPTISSGQISNTLADSPFYSTDEIKLYGGLTRNGRPAELVRVKKNGEAFSIATGLPVKMESIEDDERGGVMMKRSLSQQDADEESILRSMARRKKSESAQPPPPKVCREPGCLKEFARSCDLTKHEKTHSRPWKCADVDCKYHLHGWPTEKELDRHVNDKHAAAPKQFQCKFTDCPYKSKRESNCKQHMEKAHGWTYVRTKHNGKKNGSVIGSVKSKTNAPALPTPPTENHATPGSDGITQFTPQEDVDDFDFNNYKPKFEMNHGVFGDQFDFPDYPSGPMMTDTNPYVSPVISDIQYSASSTGTSPFLDTSNTFGAMDIVTANYGTNTDFTLFDEDIYNARAYLPPTPNEILATKNHNLLNYQLQVPQVSPLRQDQMLYTPPSLIEGSFDGTNDDQFDQADFELFGGGNDIDFTGMDQANTLFGEVPSVACFAPSSQDFYAPFYAPIDTATDMDWQQNNSGYEFIQ